MVYYHHNDATDPCTFEFFIVTPDGHKMSAATFSVKKADLLAYYSSGARNSKKFAKLTGFMLSRPFYQALHDEGDWPAKYISPK
jgi:hypothetical protein